VEPRKIEALAHVYITGVAASHSHGSSSHAGWGPDSSHSLAVSDAGAVFSWGCGRDSRLGHGSSDDVHLPKLIERLARVRIASVSAGA
jgi:alpha-tubulin suppressor-like RCC1 family protein